MNYLLTLFSCHLGGYKEFPDLKSAAQIFITQFRERKFGTMVLDKDLLSVSL